MFVAKMGKSSSHCNDPLLKGLVGDRLIKSLPVIYDTVMEVEKSLLFSVVAEVLIEAIKQGKMDSLLVRKLEPRPI